MTVTNTATIFMNLCDPKLVGYATHIILAGQNGHSRKIYYEQYTIQQISFFSNRQIFSQKNHLHILHRKKTFLCGVWATTLSSNTDMSINDHGHQEHE
ncbi:hypothetical protein MTR_4g114647 [Medicago truncatula]|uniref:Uncharacterized protein n=1 Tax=Medicago truncatula TaxID=3880 RepID=A0A072V1X0_MEDTR|nr:hypothetical protein MTR_4g114647 [Medicago truncatula]